VGNPRIDTIKDSLFIGRRALDIPSTHELKHKASKWLLEKARLVKDAAAGTCISDKVTRIEKKVTLF